MLQIRHFLLIAIHLTAVAMLIAVLFCIMWMTYCDNLKMRKFSLFMTDAARYMSLAGETFKELYLSLMHVNFVAHLLHNCAMRVHFRNIDE